MSRGTSFGKGVIKSRKTGKYPRNKRKKKGGLKEGKKKWLLSARDGMLKMGMNMGTETENGPKGGMEMGSLVARWTLARTTRIPRWRRVETGRLPFLAKRRV